MAQGDRRPKHSRQTSRVSKTSSTSRIGTQTLEDRLSDEHKRTVTYVKRVLCARSASSNSSYVIESTSLEELLPPLTSSNEVDLQLYTIIAVVLENFVQSWYYRITLDSDFTDEVVQIIAHCTRGIEQRVKCVDLEHLLLDELPDLLEAHVDAVVLAQNACSDNRPRSDAGLVYHSVRPNEALAPPPVTPSAILEQRENEVAWSQLLVSNILPLVLPPEDLQNPCLQVLVSEVFSQIIICNAICGRGSETWIIWEGLAKLINSLLRPNATLHPTPEGSGPPTDKLHQFGLLSSAGIERDDHLQKSQHGRIDAIAQVLWSTVQFLALGWILLRSIVGALMHDSSIPARSLRLAEGKTSDRVPVTAEDTVTARGDPSPKQPASGIDVKRPVVSMRIWSCVSTLTSLKQRMPWLFGSISLVQWSLLNGPVKLCGTDGALDRLMSSKIRQRILQLEVFARILQASRSALFPNYALAPTRQPPTSAEALQIKRDCAKMIIDAIPTPARNVYFATKDTMLMQEDVERTLDLFSDPYINKHLIVSAVELIVVRLFPELGDTVVED